MAIARTAITTTAAQVTSTAGTYLMQAQSSGPVFVYVAASTPDAGSPGGTLLATITSTSINSSAQPQFPQTDTELAGANWRMFSVGTPASLTIQKQGGNVVQGDLAGIWARLKVNGAQVGNDVDAGAAVDLAFPTDTIHLRFGGTGQFAAGETVSVEFYRGNPAATEQSPHFALDNREFVTLVLPDSENLYTSGLNGGFLAWLAA